MKLGIVSSVVVAMALLLPAGTVLAQDESPTPAPSMTPAGAAFAAAFPGEIGGVSLSGKIEIYSGATPEQFDAQALPLLEDVAEEAGVGLDAVLVGQALSIDMLAPDAQAVWIAAIQVPGMDPATGADLMLELFTGSTDEGLLVTEDEVASRPVTIVASPEEPEAPVIIYAAGDIAWLVMTQSVDLLEETISKLP